jgi:uncharacterized membrane protein
MSSLEAIAYRDTETAERMRQELIQATKAHLIELEESARSARPHG